MTTLVHLTTVHPRSDSRILVKEAQTLATRLPYKVMLVVADGLGHTEAGSREVAVHDLGRPARGRLNRLIGGSYRAFAAMRHIKPEVIHFHDAELIPVGLLLRVLGYHVIYDVHEDVPRQILTKYWLPGAVRQPIALAMSAAEWLGGRLFTAIVAATPTIADRFPRRKTTTLFNYPLLAELVPSAVVPYHERSASFAYVGVIEDVRGITEIVSALELLSDLPGVSFELAGRFYPEGYDQDLARMPSWRSVNSLGYASRQEVANILARVRAGMVVHRPIPNEVDALPIKLFEYMSAGLPVIASDFTPIRAIVDEVRCGLLVNPLNPAEIAAAMRWVVEHPDEARQMGERGRAAVLGTYNWNSEAAKMLKLYQGIISLVDEPLSVAGDERPKTLVHLTTVHSRADTRILLKEARTLASKLPHKVILVVADGLGDSDAGADGVAVQDLGRLSGTHALRMAVGFRRALAAINRIKPDVVHFHDPELVPLGMLLRLRGCKVIYDVHEDVPRQILLKHWIPRLIRWPLAHVIAGAEWLGAHMFTAVVPATLTIADRFPAAKTTTVCNYAMPAEMASSHAVPYIERPLSFAYVGVITGHRGIKEILSALEQNQELGPLTLELAGPISPQEYVDTLNKLPGWNLVNYRGIVSRLEVASILGRARAGLAVHHDVPSKTEALPIKLFEYMSAGLPVIASNFPVLRDIVDGARCGLLVDPKSPADIARAMRWIVENPHEAEAMGARGSDAAISLYNWNSEAKKIVSLYRRLLSA